LKQEGACNRKSGKIGKDSIGENKDQPLQEKKNVLSVACGREDRARVGALPRNHGDCVFGLIPRRDKGKQGAEDALWARMESFLSEKTTWWEKKQENRAGATVGMEKWWLL